MAVAQIFYVTKRLRLGLSGEHSSGSHDIVEEVSHPMGHDRSKVNCAKIKGKRSSINQSEKKVLKHGGMFKGLCNVNKQFAHKCVSTDNMTYAHKKIHQTTLKHLKKYIQLHEDEEDMVEEDHK
jgi:hypothetical protein